jgi:hypothetical protein
MGRWRGEVLKGMDERDRGKFSSALEFKIEN